MFEEKFLQLNIAFRIPEEIAKVAIELSGEVAKKEDAFFVLDGVEYFPHTTIYPGEFPERNLEKIEQVLESLAKEFSPVDMKFIYNKAESGWIGANFEYSEDIRKIHETIIEKINPLREGQIREKHKDIERLAKLSGQQRKNIEKYGYPNLMELYEPHLTFIKLKDIEIAEKVAKELLWKIEKFKADTIGIFVSGEHGTCRKLIKEFKFGK